MYLPTDLDLMTCYALAKKNEESGNRTMMQSWTILAHNHAVRMGYYAPEAHAVEIDWEEWASRQK